MRSRPALALAALAGGLASCSLITSFDGLGSGGAGGAGAGGATSSTSVPTTGAAGSSSSSSSSSSGGTGGTSGTGGADGGMDASTVDAGVCVKGGTYCGGDKVEGDADSLYLCKANGAATFVEHCKYGCTINPPGEDDTCQCQPGGYYCGGDKLEGDPNTLYRCKANGSGTLVMHCAGGCTVVPGQDDHCA